MVDGSTPVEAAVIEKISAIPKKVKTVDNRNPGAIVDDCISKISQYKAGGDGGNCLKILVAYVGNVYEKGTEEKFRTINMDNNAYKGKVKPFIGAKKLLQQIGFEETDDLNLVMVEDENKELIKSTLEKLRTALAAYSA